MTGKPAFGRMMPVMPNPISLNHPETHRLYFWHVNTQTRGASGVIFFALIPEWLSCQDVCSS